MANDLTRSAIADAKQVLEAARTNAKLALQETFQPTLQRMISSKLREEDDYEDDTDLEIDVQYPEDQADVTVDDGGGEGEDIGMGSFDAEEEPVDEPAPEGEEDLELESLMRELEGTDEPIDEPIVDEGAEEDWDDPVPDGQDDGMLENLLRELMGGEDDECLDENEDGGGAFEETPPTKQMNHESRKLRSENAKLRKDLNEALQAITTYKRTINEVNLLNAKLMYTTKALRMEGLNQSQKLRILESFDRAQTVRETKLVYTTILESLNRKAKQEPKRKVQEGLASKPTKAINPRTTIKESSDVLRWKQLAGLSKINY